MFSFSRPFRALARRNYATHKPVSPHAQWYRDLVPAMVPVALLGSAVYLGLQLTQSTLSHEKYLDEAHERVALLEVQIHDLQKRLDEAPSK